LLDSDVPIATEADYEMANYGRIEKSSSLSSGLELTIAPPKSVMQSAHRYSPSRVQCNLMGKAVNLCQC
jgi:hypothetical protein